MKKFVICLSAMMLTVAFAGCSFGNNDTTSSSSASSSAAPSGAASAIVSGDSASSSMAGSESAGMGEDTVSVIIKDEKMKAAYDAVQKEFAEFYVTMPSVITEQQMTEMYYINPEDIEEFAGEMSMVNLSGDTFIAVKTKPGKAATVAQALEKRKTDIIDQFATYPVNFMDVKSQAAKVIVKDDYVFMILLGNLDVPDGQSASLEMAQGEVERAEKAIMGVFETAK